MRLLHRFISLVLACILFSQCQKELKYAGSSNSDGTGLSNPLHANLQGNVLDETDNLQIMLSSKLVLKLPPRTQKVIFVLIIPRSTKTRH